MKKSTFKPKQSGDLELPFVQSFQADEYNRAEGIDEPERMLSRLESSYEVPSTFRHKYLGCEFDRGYFEAKRSPFPSDLEEYGDNDTVHWVLYYIEEEEPSVDEILEMLKEEMGANFSERVTKGEGFKPIVFSDTSWVKAGMEED